jgi:hypothetical protein
MMKIAQIFEAFSEKLNFKSNPPSEMIRQEELSHKHLKFKVFIANKKYC